MSSSRPYRSRGSTSSRQPAGPSSDSASNFRVRTPPDRGRGLGGNRGRGGHSGQGDCRGQGGHRGRGGRVQLQYVPYHTRPANASASGPYTPFTPRNQGQGPPRPAAKGPLLKPKQDWMSWQDLTVVVYGLPSETSTWDLFTEFKEHGNIQYIIMEQNTLGERNGQARIRFNPAPTKDFWSADRYQVLIAKTGLTAVCQVTLVKVTNSHRWMVQSPIHKHKSYPEVMKLFPFRIDFGFMLDTKTMMHMQSTHPQPGFDGKDLSFQVDLRRKKIVVYFPYSFSGSPNHLPDRFSNYMLWLPFEHIERIHRINIDNEKTSLLLSLKSPPCYFRKIKNIPDTHIEGANMWSEMDTWYRQTDIIFDPKHLMHRPVSLKNENVEIDIGRWTTWQFVLARSSINSVDLFTLIHGALKDFNIPTEELDQFSTTPAVKSTFWSLIDYKPPENQSALSLLDQSQDDFHLPFEIRYQLEVCISQGVFFEHNLTADFIHVLVKLARENTAKARSILEYFAEADDRVQDPMTIFTNKDALARSIRTKIPEYCAYARKATVTPSCVYFSTPSVETSNRVIRFFSQWGDRFLRVQFTDEKSEGRINSNVDKVRNDEVYSRVYRTLKNGITIGDRKYEFLAFGNSQFRQNGAYFFCPNEDVTCDHIRSWMGNFTHIKVVAKYASRLGQCFSTTRAIHGSRVEIGRIKDIERNGFNFTDGVGKISQFEAQIIANELGLPVGAQVPSVFQFRLGGCKGILTVWPDVTGRQIQIRPSQQKFEAVYNGLEIIRCSRFSTATLNRQTITILSSLGVKDEVFMDMLSKQLSEYQDAMTDRKKALEKLQKCIDENQMTVVIATMILNGFMEKKEPFVLALLHLWKAWSIKMLKEKTKIWVDGALVFGCIDETATLKGHKDDARPGNEDDLPEIFLQVPEYDNPEKYRVVEGLCVLGRNPSLHPGDIRVVMAVDIPELRHLRNVVVFPQLGDRDLAGMCSGGDLDGDDFFVIWDRNLIQPMWNLKPMNYTASPPKEKPNGKPVNVDDIKKFFVRYMKNDTLPSIAVAHLAQSDRLHHGVQDPICLKLAELHSKAVDFVKSGEEARMEKWLAPTKWPHFMESKYRAKNRVYKSEKVLGQLYDEVVTEDFVPQYSHPFDGRVLHAYQPDSTMLKTARQLKSQYDVAMKRTMAQHEIGTEFEVYTAFILSKTRIGSDYKMQEEIGGYADNLKDRFRTLCIEAAGSRDFAILAPFVAAMYRVTWEEMQIALAECAASKMVGGHEVPKCKMIAKHMPLISFPWLFPDVLCRIATGTDAKADLEGLGMIVLKPGAQQRRKRLIGETVDDDDEEDFVRTEEGITHRGELLDLFRPDREDDLFAQFEEKEPGYKDDDKPLPNTAARNFQQESDLADEFDIAELDFLTFSSEPQKSGHSHYDAQPPENSSPSAASATTSGGTPATTENTFQRTTAVGAGGQPTPPTTPLIIDLVSESSEEEDIEEMVSIHEDEGVMDRLNRLFVDP